MVVVVEGSKGLRLEGLGVHDSIAHRKCRLVFREAFPIKLHDETLEFGGADSLRRLLMS